MKTSETPVIARHIRDHLDLAYDVAATYPEVHRQLLREGLAAMKEHLHAAIPPGELEITDGFSPDPYQRYVHLSARRRTWPAGIAVAIEPQATNARQLIIGLLAQPPAQIPSEAVTKLNRDIRAGNASNHWAWWYMLDAPYRHWDEKRAVLAFGNGDAPKELAAQLLAVIRTADPLIGAA